MYNNHRLYMINKTFDRVVILYDDLKVTTKIIDQRVSRRLLNYIFPKKLPIDKFFILPNPLVMEKITNVKKEKLVIAMGRLVKLKGFDNLIRIWGLLAERHPRWKLKIFGDGPEKKNLQKLIKNLRLEKKVQILMPVKEVFKIMDKAEIYAMTSRHESFGMVTLEAMSRGLPVVAFKSKGARYLMEGKNVGFLFEHGQLESFAELLEKLIKNKNLRDRYSINAVERAKYFSINRLSQKFLKLIGD